MLRTPYIKYLCTFLCILFAYNFYGCGNGNGFEDYQMQSSADLKLTSINHPHGYGQTECFSCHTQNNIHQVNRLNTPLTATARNLISQNGISTCANCHGSNGISP